MANIVKLESEIERLERKWSRVRQLVGEDTWRARCVAVRNRVSEHLMQRFEVVALDKDAVGGQQFFGVAMEPRTPDEPAWMESVYAIGEHIDGGSARATIVRLRCWDDWDCKTAIELNKAMVARILSAGRTNFSTRMQTDVQTRSVIMWMRLRGKFFWNKNNKTNAANLYFDCASNILRSIHSDDFRGWLHAHSQINPGKADFEFLMHTIDAVAMNGEIAHECVPAALFDRREDVIYVSNGDSEMARIRPAVNGEPVIDMVPNGTDNVVFAQGMTLRPWTLCDGEGVDPFDKVAPFATANYASEHGRMIARLWFLGLLSCIRSYPAIVFTGKMRSGKSRTARGLFELLGIKVRLLAIRASGENDFWAGINKGGVICFDNVDTKNLWFGDAMQLACTDGSSEARTLFTNDQTTTLRANAKMIMTSNNPMFASESGLADRLQIVRLNQFDGKNGKEASDSAMTRETEEHRDESITWMVRVVSRALSDTDAVEKNVNMRHPDFADFVMRCARAISPECYQGAILALKSAEFDKAMLTVQNNATTNYIFEAMSAWFTAPLTMDVEWEGTASDMMKRIVEIHPDLEHSKYLSATGIGKALARYYDQMAVVFAMRPPRKYGSQTKFVFSGFSDMYAKNIGIGVVVEDKPTSDIEDLL